MPVRNLHIRRLPGDPGVLIDTLAGTIDRLWPSHSWPLLWRPLHDALIEDSLDNAERELTGTVRSPARWSRYVRLLRAIAARRGLRSGSA